MRNDVRVWLCLWCATVTGCLDRELEPLSPCRVSAVVDHVQVDRIDKVDLLFIVDSSGSMETIKSDAIPKLATVHAARALGLRIPAQAEKLKRRLGYMTQKFSLFEDLTLRENLDFMAAVQGLGDFRLAGQIADAEQLRLLVRPVLDVLL